MDKRQQDAKRISKTRLLTKWSLSVSGNNKVRKGNDEN
jgi:hypothetical protein